MSQGVQNLVSEITANRARKLSEVEQHDQKLGAMEAQLSSLTEKLSAILTDAESQDKIRSLAVSAARDKISVARESLNRIKSRLSRKGINVCVAGKSGQGKSKFLQSLTNLTEDQIPTSDGTFCTAARSRILNSDTKAATVHFMSEAELFASKILPAYNAKSADHPEALGLSPCPATLGAFISSEIALASGLTPTQEEYYDRLKKLHANLRSHREVLDLLGHSPINISLDGSEIRKYVANPEDANAPRFAEVVDSVEIATPFAADLPKGMEVFDLPGLGEIAPVIRKTMFDSIRNDADIVSILRKPSVDGERWGWMEDDYTAFDLLKEVYADEEIDPGQWVLLILNQDNRPGHENKGSTQKLKENPPRGGFVPVVCDCANPDDVRTMLGDNIEKLVANVALIDDVLLRKAENAYVSALDAYKNIAQQVEAMTGSLVAMSGGFDFKKHYKEFAYLLKEPFKKRNDYGKIHDEVKSVIADQFMKAYLRFKSIYENYENEVGQNPAAVFPEEFKAMSRNDMKLSFGSIKGVEDVVEQSANTQILELLRLLHEMLNGCCDKIKDIYLSTIARMVIDSNAQLEELVRSELGDAKNATAADKLNALKNRLMRADTSTDALVTPIENVMSVTLSYERDILPFVCESEAMNSLDFEEESSRSDIADLCAELRSEDYSSHSEAQANMLYVWIKEKSLAMMSSLAAQKVAHGIATNIADSVLRILKANHKSFVWQFAWGERVDDQWENFAESSKAELWANDYNEALASSHIGQQIRDIVKNLKGLY